MLTGLLTACSPPSTAPEAAQLPTTSASATAPVPEDEVFYGLYWLEDKVPVFSPCGQSALFALEAPAKLQGDLSKLHQGIAPSTPMFIQIKGQPEYLAHDALDSKSDTESADANSSATSSPPKPTPEVNSDEESTVASAAVYRINVQELISSSTKIPSDCEFDEQALWADQAPEPVSPSKDQ